MSIIGDYQHVSHHVSRHISKGTILLRSKTDRARGTVREGQKAIYMYLSVAANVRRDRNTDIPSALMHVSCHKQYTDVQTGRTPF